MTLLPDLARRSLAPEIMDDETSGAALEACLRDLAWLNRVTFAYRPTLRFVARALRRSGGRTLTVLDVGCGEGDTLRRLHARFGARLDLVGLDRNPAAVAAARRATPAGVPIRYETGDVFALPAERRFDLVLSALFAHHLDDESLVRFLGLMEDRAALGWFVSDLHRHIVPLLFIRLLPLIVRLDPIVAHDGRISVMRALVAHEWRALIARARLPAGAVDLRWNLLFRYGVARLR